MAAFVDRHFRAVFVATLLALLGLAWINRFVQDDAFIVFRYAQHLAAGIGPVFNPGERVEGYTCPLFMVLVAAAMHGGMDPVVAAQTIGFMACLGSLLGAFALARRLGCDRAQAWLAVVLLGTNYTFSAYATGGLETQLQTALATLSLVIGAGALTQPRPRAAALAAFSTFAGLAVLTRLDSALLVTPIALVLLAHARGRSAALAALIVPGALLVGAWLVWESRYYGTLLPNTFHAKVGAHASWARGLFYLFQFVTSYWLEAVLVLALWVWRDGLAGGRPARVLLGTLALWLAYLVAIGGDFMEFRMLVPALPIGAWFLARAIAALEARARLGGIVTALVLAGSL
ncbi:MAG: hypothetical protein HYR74_11565 [Candidatus Eisenbacteria bacterium]|nr:hypothetical protein [Candidatus Eisenbacteria bacterium]